MQSFMEQFAHPDGLLGSVAGWLMSIKNTERNRWTLEQLDLGAADHVLEIGFGPGWAVEQAARIVTAGCVAGVDTSATMLADAIRRNARAIRARRVSLQQGPAAPLPFQDKTFDKVLAVNSLQFWPDPLAGLREVRRVLRPGGRAATTIQPMWVKTDAEARQVGEQLLARLAEAGFASATLSALPLKPLCLCGLGAG